MSFAEILQIIGALMGAFATFVTGVERSFVKRLKKQGALTPESAVPSSAPNPVLRWRLGRLTNCGAVKRTDEGALFLDEAAYGRYRKKRAMRVVSLVILAVAAVLLLRYL